MIIDTHAHIGRILNFNMTEKQLLYSTEKYGIDFSLISNIECAENDHKGKPIPKILQKSQNRVLKKTIKFVRKHPDKFGILIWLRIRQELPDDEFLKLLNENRDIIYGFKLHPFHSRVAPDDERLEPVYKLAEEYNLPVVSHTGGCEQARSIHLYNAAKAHPKVKFVMVHMDLGTDNSEALNLLGKLNNLYGDTTWVKTETTLRAIRTCGSKKMMFGSDNPIDGKDTFLHNKTGDRSLYQEYFNELKNSLTSEEYDDLMYKNAQKVFNIKW
mgnify:CR=1 FL=1